MKRYKTKEGNGRILLLYLTTGLFGPQWECFGTFGVECRLKCKSIIRTLNEIDDEH